MNGRERIRAAMEQRLPDRVPVWCQLSQDHVVANGLGGKIPHSTEEYVEGACALTKRYHFDGMLFHLPFAGKGWDISWWFEQHQPTGDPTHIFDEADPDSWPRYEYDLDDDNFYGMRLAREILGPDLHVGAWMADGFSKAIQWFPAMEDALIGMQMDPERFAALVRYFDDYCVAVAQGQIRVGGMESVQCSSAYAGASFISRDMYERLAQPSVSRLAKGIQEAGGFAYVHTCGFINDRLELLAETGVNGIECMDPPPLGDASLADAKKRVGSRVFLKGNLDSPTVLWQGTDDDVDRTVRATIEAGKPNGGYILSSACSVAPQVPPARMERLVDYVEKYGQY